MRIHVCRWKIWDGAKDGYVRSSRWATPEAIRRVNGVAIPNTMIEIEADDIGDDVPGMTAKNYEPRPPGPVTFQTKIS